MASRYLRDTDVRTVSQISRKHPIIVNRSRWRSLSHSHSLDREGGFWQLCSDPTIIYAHKFLPIFLLSFLGLVISKAWHVGICCFLFYTLHSYISVITSDILLLSNKSDWQGGEDHRIFWLAEPEKVARWCNKDEASALFGDAPGEERKHRRYVQAWFIAGLDIHYGALCCSLRMVIRGLKGFLVCVCVTAYGLQKAMHNERGHSWTWRWAKCKMKGSCEWLLTVSPKW